VRWDVHNHAVPREAIELLRRADGYPIRVEGDYMEADRVRAQLTAVFTDAAAKLEQLEGLGLEAAVVSVSPALFAYETDQRHDAAALRYLVDRVGAENVAMGTDLPFDMATPEPVRALEQAVDATAARQILEHTPRRLFGL
jgi:hypothetical protein